MQRNKASRPLCSAPTCPFVGNRHRPTHWPVTGWCRRHPELTFSGFRHNKTPRLTSWGFVLALPIFPGRLQPSIVSRSELNFRVRDGNGWTLALISTNCQHSSIPSCRLMCNCLHPENRTMYRCVWRRLRLPAQIVGQALGLLVPVSCIHYCTSTSGLSTRSSLWALTPYWMRDLILGRVSRLDAFSVYLVRT